MENIHIHRIGKRNKGVFEAPKWQITIVINETLKEEQSHDLLDSLCGYLTLQCAKKSRIFHNNGLSGFSYQYMDIKRQYAVEINNFSDVDFNSCGGAFHMQRYTTLPKELFFLPQEAGKKAELQLRIEEGLVAALKCGDAISRYLLLYYLFEIIYATEDYQTTGKLHPGYDRAKLLYCYLHDTMGLVEYKDFDKNVELTDGIIRDIIRVRNDLTHRANTKEISNMMYHHLLPILQEILNHFQMA